MAVAGCAKLIETEADSKLELGPNVYRNIHLKEVNHLQNIILYLIT